MATPARSTSKPRRTYDLAVATLDLLHDHLESGAEAEDEEWLAADLAKAEQYLNAARNELPLNSVGWPFIEEIAAHLNCAKTGGGAVWDRAGDFFAAKCALDDMLAALNESPAFRTARDEWDAWQRECYGGLARVAALSEGR